MKFSNIASLFLYLIVFIISSKIYSKSEKESSKYKQIILIVTSSFLIALLAGLRYGVGTDYFSYNEIFTYIRNGPIGSLSIHDWIEPGFKVLVKFLSYFGNNQFIFGTISFLTVLIFEITLLYWKDRIDIGIAIFVYFLSIFYISFNAVRQMLAVSITFYSFKYLFINKKKMIFIIVISSLFHTASLIALPIILLWNSKTKKIDYKLLTVFSFFLIVGIIFYPYMLNFFTRFFGKYQSYETGYQSNRDFYIKILCLIFVSLYLRSIKRYDQKIELNYYIYSYAVLIAFLGFFVPYIKRIAYPFEACICVVVASIPKIYVNSLKNALLSRWIIMIGAILYFILSAYIAGSQEIFPYVIL